MYKQIVGATFVFTLLAFHNGNASSNRKFTGDVTAVDILEMYQKAPVKVGDLLPAKTIEGSKEAHCGSDVGLKAIPEKYETQSGQTFTCEVPDTHFPVGQYHLNKNADSHDRVHRVAMELKKGIVFKNEEEIIKRIPFKFIEPIYDGSDESEESRGTRFYGAVKLDDKTYADLGFVRAKGGLAWTFAHVNLCVGEGFDLAKQSKERQGLCAVVTGESQTYTGSPGYNQKKDIKNPTTVEIEAQLSPQALYKLAKLKVGDPAPEDAKGYCPEGRWEPTRESFDLKSTGASDTTSIGCNSRDDEHLMYGIDIWASRKTAQITKVTFLLKSPRFTAGTLKELDKLLGSTVLVNSGHPDIKRSLSGSDYYYFNKIEPNILVTYHVSASKRRARLKEIDFEDCRNYPVEAVASPICAKLGLLKK